MSVAAMVVTVATMFHAALAWNKSSSLPENALRRNLFQDYDRNVFPAPTDEKKLGVDVRVILSSLDNVDIRSSSAKISVIMLTSLKNHQLSWNGTEFDSVESIHSRATDVWIPQITQLESGKTLSLATEELLKISKDGLCSFPTRNTFIGICKTDITKYPNDFHECLFSFYIYNINTMNGDLTVSMVNEDQQVTVNGPWVLSKTAKIGKLFKYLSFNVALNLTRKPSYIKRKIIVPQILLSFVPVLTHALPVETGERIGFSMTGLLTMMIAIQYAMDQLPEMDEEPEFLFIARVNLILMMVSLTTTTFIMNLFHKKRRPMPHCIRKVLSGIFWLFCLKTNPKTLVVDIESKITTDEDTSNDWTILSRLLDRIFLLVFILFLVKTVLPFIQ